MATLDGEGGITVEHHADVVRYSAWMTGVLAFDNQPLTEVAAELGDGSIANVHIADASAARQRVTAVYSDPALADVLDALSATLRVRYERSGRMNLLEGALMRAYRWTVLIAALLTSASIRLSAQLRWICASTH